MRLFVIVVAVAGVAVFYLSNRKQRRAPNVILITLESLRPDHVGCYTGPKATTPALDAFARESMVYEKAYSVTSWTLAAHASIFTGLYPTAHQAVGPIDKLHNSYETLTEILAKRGYQTAGFSSGPYLRKTHNLTQGFEYYDEESSSIKHVDAHGDVTNPHMLASITSFLEQKQDRNRPLYLFAYFWDPHYDYIPPAPYNREFVGPDAEFCDVTEFGLKQKIHPGSSLAQLAYVKSQYDGEIRWTDEHLGRLFQLLRDKGLWDDTLIVVTSDHGEEFFEHGSKGHKNNLFVESVHVPLIVKYPRGTETGRDSRLASLVDVLPTILEVTDTPVEIPMHGRSLLKSDPPAARDIYFELQSVWYHQRDGRTEVEKREFLAIQQGDYKLISEPGARQTALYNVREDPGEQKDLLPGARTHAQVLLNQLQEWQAQMALTRSFFEVGDEGTLSPEELERLRSIGYLGF